MLLTEDSSYEDFVEWMQKERSLQRYWDPICRKLEANEERPDGGVILSIETEQELMEGFKLTFSQSRALIKALQAVKRMDHTAMTTMTDTATTNAMVATPSHNSNKYLSCTTIEEEDVMEVQEESRTHELGHFGMVITWKELLKGVGDCEANSLQVSVRPGRQGGSGEVMDVFIGAHIPGGVPTFTLCDKDELQGDLHPDLHISTEAPLLCGSRRWVALMALQDISHQSPPPLSLSIHLKVLSPKARPDGCLQEGCAYLSFDLAIAEAGLYQGDDPDPKSCMNGPLRELLLALWSPAYHNRTPAPCGSDRVLEEVYSRHQELMREALRQQEAQGQQEMPATLRNLVEYKFQLQGAAFLKRLEEMGPSSPPFQDVMWFPCPNRPPGADELWFHPGLGLVTRTKFWRKLPPGSLSCDAAGLGKTILEVLVGELDQRGRVKQEEHGDNTVYTRLFVVPISTLEQWIRAHIEHWTGNQKWLCYRRPCTRNGHAVSFDNLDFMDKGNLEIKNGHDFSCYDVVITTWEDFKKEVDFALPQKSTRNSGPGPSLTNPALSRSPLLQLNWRCVVFDECEELNSLARKASEMACRVPCQHKRSLSGTPLGEKAGASCKSLSAIYDLMSVLYARGWELEQGDMLERVSPLNVVADSARPDFVLRAIDLTKGAATRHWGVEALAQLLSRVMLRRTWQDVPAIPRQIHTTQYITLTGATKVYMDLLSSFVHMLLDSQLEWNVSEIYRRVLHGCTHMELGEIVERTLYTLGFFPDYGIGSVAHQGVLTPQHYLSRVLNDCLEYHLLCLVGKLAKAILAQARAYGRSPSHVTTLDPPDATPRPPPSHHHTESIKLLQDADRELFLAMQPYCEEEWDTKLLVPEQSRRGVEQKLGKLNQLDLVVQYQLYCNYLLLDQPELAQIYLHNYQQRMSTFGGTNLDELVCNVRVQVDTLGNMAAAEVQEDVVAFIEGPMVTEFNKHKSDFDPRALRSWLKELLSTRKEFAEALRQMQLPGNVAALLPVLKQVCSQLDHLVGLVDKYRHVWSSFKSHVHRTQPSAFNMSKSGRCPKKMQIDCCPSAYSLIKKVVKAHEEFGTSSSQDPDPYAKQMMLMMLKVRELVEALEIECMHKTGTSKKVIKKLKDQIRDHLEPVSSSTTNNGSEAEVTKIQVALRRPSVTSEKVACG